MQECNNFDNNGQRHGYWEVYFLNGNLFYKGNYFHGKQHDYWEVYYDNGILYYKGNYDMDEEIGLWCINDKIEFYARM